MRTVSTRASVIDPRAMVNVWRKGYVSDVTVIIARVLQIGTRLGTGCKAAIRSALLFYARRGLSTLFGAVKTLNPIRQAEVRVRQPEK